MEHFNGINGVIFDYGGTIDSRGVHWSEVIWDGYVRANVPVSKSDFRECYVFAERELARVKHIYPEHNFHDMLLIKMRIELENLVSAGKIGSERIDEWVKDIAGYCYGCAKDSVEEARPVLEALHARFPMVLVSNFYGNVETVLADFDLRKYFKEIIESAVVGVRKPDPKIFMLGVEATVTRKISFLPSLWVAVCCGSKEKVGPMKKIVNSIRILLKNSPICLM